MRCTVDSSLRSETGDDDTVSMGEDMRTEGVLRYLEFRRKNMRADFFGIVMEAGSESEQKHAEKKTLHFALCTPQYTLKDRPYNAKRSPPGTC